ncbi:MAG TPA: PrsW family glutamic-type intramembrane protease [Acidimicrobiales bacterium]|nr:PrsW family glutamic-type intramembrane protease [Acidimicrobiales bacterium]
MADVAVTAVGPPTLWDDDALAAIERGRLLAEPPAPAPLLDRYISWVTRAPRHLRSTVSMSISLLLVVASIVTRPDVDLAHVRTVIWHQVLGIGLLLLATALTRAVALRRVVSFWLFGYFLAGPAVDRIGPLLDERVEAELFQAGVVPVLEEGIKLVPVLVFAVVRSRRGWTPAATDLMVLGAAVGGGFALYEDLLWDRVASSGLGGLGTLLPTMLRDPFLASGHVVWTACGALGIGVMVLHGRRVWPFVLGPVLVVLPTLDHAVINMTSDRRDGLRGVLLDGRLVPYLLLGTLAAAVILEAGLRRRAAACDPVLPTPTFSQVVFAPPAPLFGGGRSLRHYVRRRNGFVYTSLAGSGSRAPSPEEEGFALGWLEAMSRRPSTDQTRSETDAR